MGTIIKRRRKGGSTAWLAQISITRQGKSVWRENKTFERRSVASAWIEKREKELAKPEALHELSGQKGKKRNPTLADAIDKYIEESKRQIGRLADWQIGRLADWQIGRTKAQVLRAIKTFDIGDKSCSEITSADIVGFARQKLDSGAQPQTAANYMSHLGAIFSIARPAWGGLLDPQAMDDA
ncbi:hypothetical protein [Paracoccus alkanivorans]|uniref:hypothetical protein n=1 Tax=Paracoccus alkanivorans TaxID=2116655 RepID=UPI001FB658AD|nr:hypothetical protein [Paracoccus alkanivorans]